ncbi:MAG: hypothetical protein MJ033_03020 [Victivallaceae bacterium]|nr:hypothetical protein [Victivallaceae bacterium]
MFTWIKILNRLSSENNLIEKLDSQIEQMQNNIVVLDKQKKVAEELLAKYEQILQNAQAETAHLSEQFESMKNSFSECSQLATEKTLTIKEDAEQYVATLTDQISKYESNFDEFNKKLAELKDAILNLQR